MKLSIIIAVYNEGRTAQILLNRVWALQLDGVAKELIIVESNSTDKSREICQTFAARHAECTIDTVKLILQDEPKGKGFAVRAGLEAATGDIVLIQDADLEYEVEDYAGLIKPIMEGKTDFVLGSRHMAAGNWKIRRFEKAPLKSAVMNLGGILFHSLFNIVYGQSLTDPTTMYKVFRRKCVLGLKFVSPRFDFDFELLAKLIRAGYQPLEVPVSYSSRGFDEGKKTRVIRDPLTWVRAILWHRFSQLRLNDTPETKKIGASQAARSTES
jgi:glycosyltransferase involved in cell wall biosynthesis